MATLDSSFKDQLQEALLDDIQEWMLADDGPVQGAVERSEEILTEYGQRHDYNVGPVIEALAEPAIVRKDDRVIARWGWYHPAAPHFEFGTSDHTVDGNDILSFVWEEPPQWVREEFEKEGDGWRVFLPSTDVSGLPESRFVRDGLAWLRREVTG